MIGSSAGCAQGVCQAARGGQNSASASRIVHTAFTACSPRRALRVCGVYAAPIRTESIAMPQQEPNNKRAQGQPDLNEGKQGIILGSSRPRLQSLVAGAAVVGGRPRSANAATVTCLGGGAVSKGSVYAESAIRGLLIHAGRPVAAHLPAAVRMRPRRLRCNRRPAQCSARCLLHLDEACVAGEE